MKIEIKHNSFVMFNPAIARVLAKDERVKAKRDDHLMHCALFIAYLAGWIKTNGNKHGFVKKYLFAREDEKGNKIFKEDSEKMGETHIYSIEEELCLGKSAINAVRKTLKELNLLIEENTYGQQKKFSLNFQNVAKLYEAAGDSFEYSVETKFEKPSETIDPVASEFIEGDWEGESIGDKTVVELKIDMLARDANGIILPADNKVISDASKNLDRERYEFIYSKDEYGVREHSDEHLKNLVKEVSSSGKNPQISIIFSRLKNEKRSLNKVNKNAASTSIYKGQVGI